MKHEYQHYPLALYRRGEYMAVANEAQEAQMRAQGWTDYLTDKGEDALRDQVAAYVAANPDVPQLVAAAEAQIEPEPPKRKPGRPKKA